MEIPNPSELERFFTEEKASEIKKELLSGSDRQEFKKLYKLAKDCFERDEFGDSFSVRLVYFYHWLIDNDKSDELYMMLMIFPLWGSYSPSQDTMTPLSYAISKHKNEMSKTMIKIMAKDNAPLNSFQGPDPGYVALTEKEYDIVAFLLDNGADERFFCGPYTGLQVAALTDDLFAASMLIEEYHHDVNMTVVVKKTPLNIAAERDDHQMAAFFLAQPGIDVNKTDEDGKNAIEYAQNDDMRKLLLDKGAHPADENTKLICEAIKAAVDSESETLDPLVVRILSLPNAAVISGEFDLLYHTVKYDMFDATRMIVESGVVDLSGYDQNLFWLSKCVYRKDLRKRTYEEYMRYLHLFDKYGYRFNFPADSCEHWLARSDCGPESEYDTKEAREIMRRAGVIFG